MTNEKLQAAKELERKISFHNGQVESFETAIKHSKEDYGSTNTYHISSSGFNGRVIRKKSTITFLEIEKQYHYQEAERLKSELNKL
jgi:hypothetical protein